MAKDINYWGVEVPDGKDPDDYHYTERRAEILQIIDRHGHPYAVKQVDLADRYGVTQGTISKDMDVLRKFASKNLGQNAKLMTRSLFRRVVKELLEDGEQREAWKTAMEWNEWLQDIGEQETAPDQLELLDGRETDSYEILEDDEEIDYDSFEPVGIRGQTAGQDE